MSALNRRMFLQSAALGAGSLFVGWSNDGTAAEAEVPFVKPLREKDVPEKIAPIDAPFAMPNLVRPTFPDRLFDIRDYGAEPGGETKNTEAFADAVAACHDAGGGRVVVPSGEWLTGPIHLRSNVNLHVTEEATVRFSDEREDYLPVVHTRSGGVEVYNYSPLIYAPNCSNIAVTGKGTLDGNGGHWWEYFEEHQGTYERKEASRRPLSERRFGEGKRGLRPTFLQPWKSENVLIEGITLINTPNWTVHPVYCENVIVRDVHIQSLEAPNGDGVVPDSCRNMLVEYCHFETGDDAIPIKSGLNEDGRRVGMPSENIVVRHINARDVRTGSGGIVIGSETSGGIRNVYVHDCLFVETDRGIRLKSERGRGEVVENLYIRDVEMRDVQNQAININSFYSGGEATGPAPLFRNINIQNVRVDGAAMGIELIGLPEEWVQGFRLKNVTIRADKGVLCRRVKGLTMSEAEVEAGEQVFELDNCTDVTLRWLDLTGGESPIVVQGEETGDVRIDESPKKAAIEVGPEVPNGAVVYVD